VQAVEAKLSAAEKIATKKTSLETNDFKKLTPDEISQLLKLISSLNAPAVQAPQSAVKLNEAAKSDVIAPIVAKSEPSLVLEVVKQPAAIVTKQQDVKLAESPKEPIKSNEPVNKVKA
jgi:hypothetical protein